MKRNLYQLRFITKVFCLILVLLFATQKSFADHVVGSDITYKCTTTPGIYEVTFVFYRACTGIEVCYPTSCGASCSRTLQMYGADPGCDNTSYGSISMSLQNVRDMGLNPACPTAKSICTNMNCVTAGTYTPAIERYEFKGFANVGATSGIPSSCCNVRFVFTECCRNAEINTGATWQNFYVDAIVNRCLSATPCNSSPELTNDPFAVMCGGENYVFNNGAIDPDFDSLSFAFAPALQSYGSSVTYDPPWAYDKPMPWSGPWNGTFPAGIQCDPLTGDIMFTPGNASGSNFYGIMCVEVKQWKTINGVPTVIGKTRRDIEMCVLANCPPNNTPHLVTNPPNGSNPNAPKTQWEVCAGEQLCFTVTAKDTDFMPPTISDTTDLSWNNSIGSLGATFLPTYDATNRHKAAPLGGPREDQFQFCWTPDDSRASNTPYYFTISAKDSRCPNPGRVTRAFSVKVYGRADLTPKNQKISCGKFRVSYTNNKVSVVPQSVLWQISSVPGDFSMSQNPYTSTSTSPFDLTFRDGGKYLSILTANTRGPSGTFCTKTFYDTIMVDTSIKAVLRDTFTCIGNSVQLRGSTIYGIAPVTYKWYNSIRDTALPPLNAPFYGVSTYTVTPMASKYYTIKVQDLNGCNSFDSLLVSVKQLPQSLLLDSTRICYGDTFVLDPGNNGGNIQSWKWSTNDTTQKILGLDSGRFIVTLTDTFGCKLTDSMSLYVNKRIIANAGLDTTVCYGDSSTLKGSGGGEYQWKELSSGTILSAKSTTSSVRVAPTSTATPTKYELTVYTNYPTATYKECSLTDTVILTVKPLPVLTRPNVTQACRSTSSVFLPGFTNNQPGGVGVWSYPPAPGAITNSGAQVRVDSLKNIPSKDTTGVFANWLKYKYTSTSVFGGCSKTDSANITIYGNPAVDGGPKLTWCENGGIYSITTQQAYSPKGGQTAQGEDWTGLGVYSQTVGITKRWYFDPTIVGVPKLPSINIATYKYTRIYNPSTATEISCFSSDTVQLNVTKPPVIVAGSDVMVCNNEPLFNISQKAGSSITPNTGATYWTSSTAGLPIVNDSQDFRALSIVVPAGSSTVSYKMYINDISTGCLVTDSMQLTVAQVPAVRLIYDTKAIDSINVCQNTKKVYFRIWATSAFGASFEPTIGLDFSGSSSAFGANTNIGANSSRGVFNSVGAALGLHKLKVTYTDNSTILGCHNSDSNTVNVLEPAVIQATTPPAICSYDLQTTVTLSQVPNIGRKLLWSTAGDGEFVAGTDTSITSTYKTGANDRSGMQVQLTATSQKSDTISTNGDQCAVASSTVTLLIDRAPIAKIVSSNTEGCIPLTSNYAAGATGVSNAQFKWEWENEPSLTRTDSAISRYIDVYNTQLGGKYRNKLTVTSTVNTTCSTVSDWSTMQTHAIPVASFMADPPSTTIAKPFFNFINQSSVIDNSNLSYLWNLGPGPDPTLTTDRHSTEINPINIEYAADTACQEVRLQATTQFGCVDSTNIKVCIKPDITVFIPNAFMPNNTDGSSNSQAPCLDGTPNCNKVFRVAASGQLSIEIFIYNRWGQLVYKDTNTEPGWDGTVLNNGRDLCPQDVYVYQVNATSYSGKKYKYSGSITLLR